MKFRILAIFWYKPHPEITSQHFYYHNKTFNPVLLPDSIFVLKFSK